MGGMQDVMKTENYDIHSLSRTHLLDLIIEAGDLAFQLPHRPVAAHTSTS